MMADAPSTPSDYLKQPYCRVVIPDHETGTYTARVMEFPGCVTQGDSIAQAHERLERAAEDWIRAALDSGQDIPRPAQEQSYSGRILVRLPRSLHQRAAEAAEADATSLNQFIVAAVAERVGASAQPGSTNLASHRSS
jgi:predicted RNase H-like HicB family nuclease